jgi:cystathionine beta-lyase/cystathionine gamma-synthase
MKLLKQSMKWGRFLFWQKEDAVDFSRKPKVFTLAESLRSRVVGKIILRWWHASIPENETNTGITDDLVRLPVQESKMLQI